MKQYYNEVFSSDKGKIVLKHLKNEMTWFDKSTVSQSDNGVDKDMMLLKEGKRTVWIKIKELLNEDLLKEIEII